MMSRKSARMGASLILWILGGSMVLMVGAIIAQLFSALEIFRTAVALGAIGILVVVVWVTTPRHPPCSRCATGSMSTPRIHEKPDGSIVETCYCRACGYVQNETLRR
jgi:hypothetical protein